MTAPRRPPGTHSPGTRSRCNGRPTWSAIIRPGSSTPPAPPGDRRPGVLTHGQMEYVVCNHLCDLMPGTTEHDASLVVAPLSHGAGVHALPQIARGAAIVLLSGERLDCEEAWRLVERHRVTNMFTVPTILTMLTRHEAVDRYDHSSLRYVIYAGAPMYRADQVHALRKLGQVLVQYFGLGEVTGNITVLPPHLHSEDDAAMPVGSCGVPRTGHGRRDPRRRRRPASRRCHRRDLRARAWGVRRLPRQSRGHREGRSRMAGSTPATSATWTRRASSTSPAARRTCISPAGRTCIRARSRKPCCCIPRWRRPASSACRTRNGARAASPSWCWSPARTRRPRSLLAHLDGKLAKYKWPNNFAFWPELPKSGYGKVVKRDVKRLLQRDV